VIRVAKSKAKTGKKRIGNRKPDDMRPIEIEVGVISKADGSAMFKIGDTVAIAAVYGPKEMHPKRLQDAERGVLRCRYDMISFSVSERARMGPSRRSTEIGSVMSFALSNSVFLERFPKTVIDVHVEVLQANAGTRCASICAASLALADAGIPMRGLVASIAVGKVGDMVVVDLTKEEEDVEGATDIPIAYSEADDAITSIQLDGMVSRNDLKKAMDMGVEACKKIIALQKKALKQRYGE
jgi:exosome complex component RRP41